jgi:hypothetical protein
MFRPITTLLFAAALGAPLLNAQFDFDVDGKSVQIHSFASQGFAYSNDNNYLTMNTSQGSFDFTDGGINVSTQLTDKFRVGAQGYIRSIGQLGEWHPQLDWAYADYRFKDWFGIRAGKVKTAMGLYNDTQDAESLNTWALLPQSMYPLDLRSTTISHTGGDVYGSFSLHRAGSISYTAYYGARSFDKYGGVYYLTADQGIPISNDSGKTRGADVRWNTPVQGLMLGGSFGDLSEDRRGYWTTCLKCTFSIPGASYRQDAAPDYMTAAYADYLHGNWHFATEFRREQQTFNITSPAFDGVFVFNGGNQSFFVSAAYRVSKWLELGTYNSRFYFDQPDDPKDPADTHIFDQTITARFDLRKWWSVKVEEHFIDGYGDVYSAHGFYTRSNLAGLKPKTDLFVIRTGVSF